MVTGMKTKTKGRGKRGQRKNGDAPCNTTGYNRKSERIELLPLDLEVERIERCPFQPREHFPDAEIRALADAIAGQGQIHPIAVRPAFPFSGVQADRFELVDGERRLRAVKLLGWKTIRSEVGPYTDAQVRAIVLTTALQRADLSAIEEARAFRAAIDAGDADGPTQLATQLGLSQGHVSNRLRLLELPERIQAKVISREIPATHARSIARYAGSPALLKKIEEGIVFARRYHGGLPSAQAFDGDVDRMAYNATRTMDGRVYSHKLGRNIPLFTPTDEQRDALGLIEVTQGYMPKSQNKPELRATNTELWEKLQAEQEARLVAQAEKRSSKAAKGAKEKPTAAETRAKEAARAEKLAQGIWAVAIDWRRVLIAEACRTEQVSPEDLTRLLFWQAFSLDAWRTHGDLDRREDQATDTLKARRARPRRGGGSDQHGLFAFLCGIEDRHMLKVALWQLAELIWHPTDGPVGAMPDEVVLQVADQLALDVPAAWKKNAAGPLTERWLNLRNKEALVALAQSWGVSTDANTAKPQMVAALLKAAKKQKPPAELLKPKRPK